MYNRQVRTEYIDRFVRPDKFNSDIELHQHFKKAIEWWNAQRFELAETKEQFDFRIMWHSPLPIYAIVNVTDAN